MSVMRCDCFRRTENARNKPEALADPAFAFEPQFRELPIASSGGRLGTTHEGVDRVAQVDEVHVKTNGEENKVVESADIPLTAFRCVLDFSWSAKVS